MSHKCNFQNHPKNANDHLYKTEEKLCYLEDSSQRNNLRTEGVEKEEADDENWDQCKEKVLKSKLKIEM